MEGLLPLELVHEIDPSTEWLGWGNMLRGHPKALDEILALCKPARSQESSMWKAMAIYRWLRQAGCSSLHLQQAFDEGDDPMGGEDARLLRVATLTSDPHTHPADPVLTTLACDSKPFQTHDLGHWETLDGQTIWELRAAHAEGVDHWIQQLYRAERQWFATSPLAPVCLVGAVREDNTAGIVWEATQDLLQLSMEERTWPLAPDGQTAARLVAMDATPQQVKDDPCAWGGKVWIYPPGPARVARVDHKALDGSSAIATRTQGKRRL